MSAFLNTITQLQPNENASEINLGIQGSIEDHVKNLYAKFASESTNEKMGITEDVNKIDATNPAALLEMQDRIGNYSLTINFFSTVAHKGASAIETLLKAQ